MIFLIDSYGNITISPFATARSEPAEGLFFVLKLPFSFKIKVEEPPPSRFIASVQPRLPKRSARSANVAPFEMLDCLPSTTISTTSPLGFIPTAVLG